MEEHGREAGVGGGGDPGLDDGAGGGRAGGEGRRDGGEQAPWGFRPGDDESGEQAQEDEAAQGPAVVAGEPGAGQAEAQAAELGLDAGLVQGPELGSFNGGGGWFVLQHG